LIIAPSLTKDVFARLKRRALVDLCCFSECLVDRHFFASHCKETKNMAHKVLISSSRHAPILTSDACHFLFLSEVQRGS
jgi:hypothetical protein